MPALLKGFLEQVARPGFAFRGDANNPFAAKGLKGRSARVVVTMGMPAFVYRFYFRAHSVKNLERNILGFVGVAPIHATLVGLVESMSDARRSGWLKKLAELGRRAA
jgi:putative NADPH-quinone reductase